MNNKLIPLLILGLFSGAYFVGQWLQPGNEQHNMALKEMRYESCNPAESDCVAYIGKRKLVISFSRTPSALQAFKVQVLGKNIKADSMHVEFSMQGMDMGMNRHALKPMSDESWSTEVILPVCSLGRHDWKSRFEIVYQNTIWHATFNFEQASN